MSKSFAKKKKNDTVPCFVTKKKKSIFTYKITINTVRKYEAFPFNKNI